MIAYNNGWLMNVLMHQQSEEAYRENCLQKEELDRIKSKYPVGFYSPNIFIRIGLFILTLIIVSFSFGILALLFMDAIDTVIGGLAVFFGIIIYAALEFMIKNKNHYQSGVDDALLWISAVFIFGGISYLSNPGDLNNCLLALVISSYCTLRFTDRLMALIAYLSLLGVCFIIFSRSGTTLKALVPFILMAVSAGTYFLSKRPERRGSLLLYSDCLQIISIASLLGFYFAGNYYVVRELSNAMFNLNLAENQTIPFGWLFWIFTCIMPLGYLLLGIQKKDKVLISTGLMLVAVIVLTIKNYYNIASAETIMTISGLLLLGISYALTRYLKEPKYGYFYQDVVSDEYKDKLEIESLVIAQTFTPPQAEPGLTSFGGGSFGGGGSSGDF